MRMEGEAKGSKVTLSSAEKGYWTLRAGPRGREDTDGVAEGRNSTFWFFHIIT